MRLKARKETVRLQPQMAHDNQKNSACIYSGFARQKIEKQERKI
jgi:hypothetical protein